MGACFITMTTEETDEKKVQKEFDERVEEDEYEYGHDSYNGTFSTMSGLCITSRTFHSRDEAEDYIMNNTEKWGCAKAVIVEKEGRKPYTLIGGWAAE